MNDHMNVISSSCHRQDLSTASSRGRRLVAKLHSLLWRVRNEGIVAAWNCVAMAVRNRLPRSHPPSSYGRYTTKHQEPLNLKIGEWVQIKSKEQILATLDDKGRCRGLGMMPEMWPLCGRVARVLKPVQRIVIETPDGADVQETRSMKHTVLLEGLTCDGVRLRCDRTCFFFWREDWLIRTQPPDASRQS